MSKIKRLAVLTSGGDAPGMNAAIRAVVLTAKHYHIEVIGFFHGYNGLLTNDHKTLNHSDVGNIINQGGTILKSARCDEFKTADGINSAARTLEELNIDCLIVIGGDGSFRGAQSLGKQWGGQIIGIPGTIDNDIGGTDATIGFATAVDTAVEAIDKIRDTADAFERIFLVEVMGRHSSYLAMDVAIASAAEQVLTFENRMDAEQQLESIINHIKNARRECGKSSYIMVIAENLWPTGSSDLAKAISKQADIDCQPCILGHIQRGGRPVSHDRILATKLGVASIITALVGDNLVMIGEENNKVCKTPLDQLADSNKTLDHYLFNAQRQLFEFNDKG